MKIHTQIFFRRHFQKKVSSESFNIQTPVKPWSSLSLIFIWPCILGINSHSVELCHSFFNKNKVKDVYIKIPKLLLVGEEIIWSLIAIRLSLENQKCCVFSIKTLKQESNQETSRRVVLIHSCLFTRKWSSFYVWMTVFLGLLSVIH